MVFVNKNAEINIHVRTFLRIFMHTYSDRK